MATLTENVRREWEDGHKRSRRSPVTRSTALGCWRSSR